MKSYILVSNDEKEIPLSEEILGREALLEKIGLCSATLSKYMKSGFPDYFKYKVKLVKERQIDDLKKYHSEYDKRRIRKAYRKAYYELGKRMMLK